MSVFKQLVKPDINISKLRQYRLGRLRQQLADNHFSLMILTNPVSMRYAIDLREYQLFQSHIPTYYLFIPVEGDVILYGASPLVADLVDQLRPAHFLNVFDGGLHLQKQATLFADETNDYINENKLDPKRILTERLNPSAYAALMNKGMDLFDAEPYVEQARLLKSQEELDCMRYTISVTEYAMSEMQKALIPGITENQLFAILHQINIAHDGDWIDGRMLNSGMRSNPWFQQASDEKINAGEMVAFDTDLIGPFGYCADISRTFFCEPGQPTDLQRRVYQYAYEELHYNIDLIKPGLTYKELSDLAYRQHAEFIAHRYVCLAHGVGMSDEYPKIYYREDWQRDGYDGVIVPNTVLSVESFTGSVNGGPGVKLEQMVLVTQNGCEPISHYPFEEMLLR